MPDIDGNELVLWLVEQHCAADVIIITGYHPDYAVNARLLAEFKPVSVKRESGLSTQP
jgi:response regulator of citrate/malate metabolism